MLGAGDVGFTAVSTINFLKRVMTPQEQQDQSREFSQHFDVQVFPGASELKGLILCDRWEIRNLLHESPQESGGNFGVGYVVFDKVRKLERFLKVVDYRKHMRHASQLAALINEANFEITMHKYCGEKRMSKVVQMIQNGELVFRRIVDGEEYNFLCLILERGVGDIKSHVNFAPNQSPYWKVSVLRDVALAISQIERASLAHNDVKPSNVIRFESTGDTHSVKLGDIGRAVRKDGTGPFDSRDWAGDRRHQPIELFYGWKEPEWQNRRTVADAYMLGSLASYLFIGASITERVLNSLPPEYHYSVYTGNYRQILDIVRHTWTSVFQSQVVPMFPKEIRSEMADIVSWLTDPDPRLRGDPAARREGTVGLDRIQSRLVRMAHQARILELVRN